MRCKTLQVNGRDRRDRRSDRDLLIAATAAIQGLILVTCNVGDFEPAGMPVLDPWRA